MEKTECSEKLAYKIQTLGNYPEESIQHSEHGESLKSRTGMKNWAKKSCWIFDLYWSHIWARIMQLVVTRLQGRGMITTRFNSQHGQEDTLLKSAHTGSWATQSSLQWVEGCKPATASHWPSTSYMPIWHSQAHLYLYQLSSTVLQWFSWSSAAFCQY